MGQIFFNKGQCTELPLANTPYPLEPALYIAPPILPLKIQGIVQEGKKEARTLNFPTANVAVRIAGLNYGVYSCRVLANNVSYDGMAYIDQRRPAVLEAHLFEFDGNLYGKDILVELKTFIRAPQHNLSFEEVKELIHKDAALCREDLQKVAHSKE